MTAAVAIDLEEQITPEQQIYRAEKARRAARVRPEMAAAAAELGRIEQIARENGKGGRPKGSGVNVGKAAPFRARSREPEPDAPGRPEWLTPPTPPKEPDLAAPARRPLPPTPTMPEFQPKDCARCGDAFQPKGANSKFCTDACARAAKDSAAADAPRKKPKADKPKKKRKPIRTGYHRESKPSTRAASTSSMLDQLKGELETVDARREHLVSAIDALVRLEQLA